MIDKLIDLDAILEETAEITLKLNSKQHKLVPANVETFIANARAVAEMAQRSEDSLADLENGTKLSIEILARSWPTVPPAELAALTLVQLQKLVTFTRVANGEASAPTPAPAPAGANGEAPVPSIGSEAPVAPPTA